MEKTSVVLLTIIAEHVLRERLIADVQEAGARGYTILNVEGEGSRHRRVGDLLGANIKLETVVTSEAADQILAQLARDYFPRFAIIAYTSSVQVLRGEKYV